MAPRFTTQARRLETDEEKLERFVGLRDSSNPHDAEEAMRLAERLVERYMPLVGAAVRRWRAKMPASARTVGFDDLKASGIRGLWEALLVFDPGRGTPFALFASSRISFAISDEIRGADLVKKQVRSEVQRCWRAVSSLESRLGREVTDQEAARASRVSVDRYRDLCLWDRRSITAELTTPAEKYLSGTEGDPLERLCAIEEALEALEGYEQEIREAALEIGVAVESVKGYFTLDDTEPMERAA